MSKAENTILSIQSIDIDSCVSNVIFTFGRAAEFCMNGISGYLIQGCGSIYRQECERLCRSRAGHIDTSGDKVDVAITEGLSADVNLLTVSHALVVRIPVILNRLALSAFV